MTHGADTFELAKMAVSPAAQVVASAADCSKPQSTSPARRANERSYRRRIAGSAAGAALYESAASCQIPTTVSVSHDATSTMELRFDAIERLC